VRRLLLIALVACKSKRDKAVPEPHDDDPPIVVSDARVVDAANAWPELAPWPAAQPNYIVAIPTKTDQPRFEVAGPVILGDLAVVASSQFGFAAVDWRRGQIAWSKVSGMHVAPPIAIDNTIVLIGSCVNPPDVADLLGCLRVVLPTGADQANIAIHGKAPAFASSTGAQDVWRDGDHAVRWRRGDEAIAIDLLSGVAKPASAKPPPLVIPYKDKKWIVTHADDGKIVATGKPDWQTKRGYTELLGAVYLPEEAPMVRVANRGAYHGSPEIQVMDMDATGSMNGQVAFPVPGIAITSHAISSVGDVVMAIRLDASLERDFVVGYAASALIMWVYPLPIMARPDPVGVAIASEATVVFHDGDTVTILPELSAPPTAPGAVRAPSQNPTP
jgi:hypothetical protein